MINSACLSSQTELHIVVEMYGSEIGVECNNSNRIFIVCLFNYIFNLISSHTPGTDITEPITSSIYHPSRTKEPNYPLLFVFPQLLSDLLVYSIILYHFCRLLSDYLHIICPPIFLVIIYNDVVWYMLLWNTLFELFTQPLTIFCLFTCLSM